jgi:hypothetical protein
MDEDGAKYQQVARLQYAEIERLRAVVKQRDAELDGLVSWIAGDQGALEFLQSIYADPRQSTANRLKSSLGALPFERGKPAAVGVVIDFKARVRNARLKAMERDKARWALEDAAKVIEHEPTILGSDETLDPEPAA